MGSDLSDSQTILNKLHKFSITISQETGKSDPSLYNGIIRKLCLLGGGSEAKVYLVKLEEIEEIVALKMYELTKKNNNTKKLFHDIKKEFLMLQRLKH